jgi:hypothetical protein
VAVKDVPPPVRVEVAAGSQDAAVKAFHVAIAIATTLVALGGVLGLVGIVNPRRRVEAEECPGGQLAGVPSETARSSPCDWQRQADASREPASSPA